MSHLITHWSGALQSQAQVCAQRTFDLHGIEINFCMAFIVCLIKVAQRRYFVCICSQ